MAGKIPAKSIPAENWPASKSAVQSPAGAAQLAAPLSPPATWERSRSGLIFKGAPGKIPVKSLPAESLPASASAARLLAAAVKTRVSSTQMATWERVTIGGNLKGGGVAQDSGEINSGGKLASVKIGGSVIGNNNSGDSGVISSTAIWEQSPSGKICKEAPPKTPVKSTLAEN